MKRVFLLILLSTIVLAQPKLAVYGFTSDTFGKTEIASLNSVLESALIDLNYFKVLTREDIKLILKERNLSETGLVKPQDFGKMIGARYVVFGKVNSTFGKPGYVTVSVKIIDVESGEIVFSEAVDVPRDSVSDAVKRIVKSIEYRNGKIVKNKKVLEEFFETEGKESPKSEKKEGTFLSIGAYYFYDPECVFSDYYYYYCNEMVLPMLRIGGREGSTVYGFNVLLGVFAREYVGPLFFEIGTMVIFIPYIEAGLAVGPLELSLMYLIFPGISVSFTF